MEKVTRFGISLEPDLLEKVDALVKQKNYASRSEAMRDLMRDAISREDVEAGKGLAVGTLSILYDHHAGNVMERLIHKQHHSGDLIIATTHVHVDEQLCLEVLILRGKAKDIKKLADGIRAIKGVLNGALNLSSLPQKSKK
jgi:CopG family nickel-responsive transcriptional regulator